MQNHTVVQTRRKFLGVTAATVAAVQLGLGTRARGDSGTAGASSFPHPLKQIDAGVLNVGYVEAGPSRGPAVILLHG